MVKPADVTPVVAQGADEYAGAGTHYVGGKLDPELAQSMLLLQAKDFRALLNTGQGEVRTVRSPDELLHSGIADYTFIPGEEGVLGRGKFSTVYKVKDVDGRYYALKHTPLYPHHPLIAARLLREPTLLAQIPPHPCLIGVQGWIKTRDHFYLVEDLSAEHISLADIPTPVENIGLVRKILDQLVSVVRDGLHEGGRVCHRDLKTENILINDHGDVILLDLGLATRFSASAPKLTTCCGSPAFHSPEIVQCLNNPPGTYSYYGPELDIWCIGLTLLVLLTGRRYPIGSSHRYLEVMAQNVTECLKEIEHIRQRIRSRRSPSLETAVESMQAESDWDIVLDAVTGFLQIDGDKRISSFKDYKLDESINQHVMAHKRKVQHQRFKTISFEPAALKYTIPMSIEMPDESPPVTGEASLRLRNIGMASGSKVHSYIKYLLRSIGILYHTSHRDSKCMILQCVMILPPDSPDIPKTAMKIAPSLLNTIFGKRSASVPPVLSEKPRYRSHSSDSDTGMPSTQHCIRFWMRVCCDCDVAKPSLSSMDPPLSPANGWVPPFLTDLVVQNLRPSPPKRAVSYSSAKLSTPTASTHETLAAEVPLATAHVLGRPHLTSSRKRSSSQHNTRFHPTDSGDVYDRFISLRVSDGRCLGTLVAALKSSQTQGLVSPHSVRGELDIDDRDEAIKEAMRVCKKPSARRMNSTETAPNRLDSSESRGRGLKLRLSGSYNGSHVPFPGLDHSEGDGDRREDEDDEKSPIIQTPVLGDQMHMEEEERLARSKEQRGLSHVIKSRAENPDIQITPVNAFYYERAHSASPARLTRALPPMR